MNHDPYDNDVSLSKTSIIAAILVTGTMAVYAYEVIQTKRIDRKLKKLCNTNN